MAKSSPTDSGSNNQTMPQYPFSFKENELGNLKFPATPLGQNSKRGPRDTALFFMWTLQGPQQRATSGLNKI
ncbi:MAG: hypothetical protein ACI92Z_002576 [Paracoccaceae bacterium]|jgi:hypothetical protein